MSIRHQSSGWLVHRQVRLQEPQSPGKRLTRPHVWDRRQPPDHWREHMVQAVLHTLWYRAKIHASRLRRYREKWPRLESCGDGRAKGIDIRFNLRFVLAGAVSIRITTDTNERFVGKGDT